MAAAITNLEIRVRGTVQGVGFRPYVWRIAREEGLAGEVLNDGDGVLIRTAGGDGPTTRFLERLRREVPPLANIESLQTSRPARAATFDGFRIIASVAGENRTRVAPDAAICGACAAEIHADENRRYQYPFNNCTHCGPRFSIVHAVPYDRARTTMAGFAMCAACAVEYGDPADRRFHAQAIACATCGPRVWLEAPPDEGARRGAPADASAADAVASAIDAAALDDAAARLVRGEIVAIRGIGGFHLACDATQGEAVARLRRRKHREAKPFAVMVRDVAMARRYGALDDLEEALLRSPEAPIVLVAPSEALPEAIAPGLDRIGLVLPYTPLHHLLLARVARPLVMTSGNLSSAPQIIDNDAARRELRDIADAWLMHDREIANRIDDSVVRVVGRRPRMLRRARGYAPSAIALPPGFDDAPAVLAHGGELKATFCLVQRGAAILSQHQGDLEDAATFADYQRNLALYAALYDHAPSVLAADLHPEYLSTKLAHERAASTLLPLIGVQHHHAHVASCLVEHGRPLDAPPVLGVVLDGLGYGDDQQLWGGELLIADYRQSRRVGALTATALIGGAQAMREPWRNTYAQLVSAGWSSFRARFAGLDFVRRLEARPLAVIDRMLASGLNVPRASSCGRLFDAVAAALGMCADRAQFEGQGAMQLEAAANAAPTESILAAERYAPIVRDADLLRLDPAPLWWALGDDLLRGVAPATIALRFHHGLALGIAAWLRAAIARHAPAIDTVVLSGGCFQNQRLLETVALLVEGDGRACLSHGKVPANDGGIALGQAAVAAARCLSSTPIS